MTATLIALLCCAVCATGTAAAFSVGGPGVDPWPFSTLQLGVMSMPGQAAAQQALGHIGMRYAYLSGGVNTGQGWSHWALGGGSYVSEYLTESEAAGVVPVFSYYQLRQSLPGRDISDESTADLSNLRNRATMRAYFKDLRLFFEKAAAANGPVILQVEPDLWGYIEAAGGTDGARRIPVAVARTGMPDLRGLANNAVGLAQAILVLRNNYAPKVIVAYHDSSWGTGMNIQSSHPDGAQVARMAARSIAFYRSLHANFDAIFSEMADRDAGYAQTVNGAGTSLWWSPLDFAHLARYLGLIHRALKRPIVVWQIPVGTRHLRNTPYRYGDNKVESLLDRTPRARALLDSYARAGVAALLFGPGQPTDTQVGPPLLRLIAAYYRRGVDRRGVRHPGVGGPGAPGGGRPHRIPGPAV